MTAPHTIPQLRTPYSGILPEAECEGKEPVTTTSLRSPDRTLRAASTLAWKVYRRLAASKTDGAFVSALLGEHARSPGEVAQILDEIAHDEPLAAHLASLPETSFPPQWFERFGNPPPRERLYRRLELNGQGRAVGLLLYVTLRIRRPRVVIETGCHTGWTSALILAALNANGFGRLYTLDKRTEYGQFEMLETLPDDVPVGFTIPESYKTRWEYIHGDIRETLAPTLDRVGPIDFFWHDSDHSYLHQMFEYSRAWSALSSQGILASDDVAWSMAFWDFARGVAARPLFRRGNANVGAVRKP